jgi:radical SAM superfamily enzyme YgiQ (UPF0313 family)
VTRRLRILLVRPPQPHRSIGLRHVMVCNPIELEYVAATCPDHEVRIFDGILERRLADELRTFQPDVVGTSAYINAVGEVAGIVATARALAPRAVVVVGGVHATVVPEDFAAAEPDAVVRGDGMAAFREIVDRVARGERELSGIAGVVPRDALAAGRCGDIPRFVDPDSLPFPARELTRRHWERYWYVYHRPVTMMKTSFGCPYRCSFCYCWRITAGEHRVRSPESIADELERIWAPEVYLVDDDFLLSEPRLWSIHDELSRRGIRKGLFCYGRSDFIATHPELLKALSRAGLKAVVVGVESPNQHELDAFDKRTDAAVHEQAFAVLREANVDVYASFILNPAWGDREFRALERYILRNRLYYVILQPLMPLPGTALWEEWRERVFIRRDHHEIWDISHLAVPSHLPMWRYYAWMLRLYLRSYLSLWRVPGLRLRTMPPLFSREVPRVLWGALQIGAQLVAAPGHYSPDEREAFRRMRAERSAPAIPALRGDD